MPSKTKKIPKLKPKAVGQTFLYQSEVKYQQALGFHQMGHLAEARLLYESVLLAQPNHFDALHYLGIIFFQMKDDQKAADLIGKAIQINPENAEFHSNRGLALYKLNQLSEAVACYDCALALKSDYFEASYNRGLTLQLLGKYEAAVSSFEHALTIKPNYAEAFLQLGLALQALNKPQDAVASYNRALEINPQLEEVFYNRGIAQLELTWFDAAVASFDQAIKINPNYARAHSNRGLALHALNQPDEAISSYMFAIEINPVLAEAHYNIGIIFQEKKQFEAAIACFDQAIVCQPNYANAYSNMGASLHETGKYGAALASYEAAIAIKPSLEQAHYNRGIVLEAMNRFKDALASYDVAILLKADYAEAYSNRGNVLKQLHVFDSAIASYDCAIAIKSDYADAYYNRGLAQRDLKRLTEAVASYDCAIAIRPDYSNAYWNKSLALLLNGDLLRGWELYEWRWSYKNSKIKERKFPQPRWCGELLSGKKILLHSEQGFGDSFQFCRYVTLLSNLGAFVILEAEKPLAEVLKNVSGVAGFFIKGEPLPEFDYHCPLMSLPLIFKTDLNSIPSSLKYLSVEADKLFFWQNKLPKKEKIRVGLVWSGNEEHANDLSRSIPLSDLIEKLPQGYEYVSLQKFVRNNDRKTLEENTKILHYGDSLLDFSDTAALCELMDVIISVDTSVAHLSAALGKRTWIMLPFIPDWRWLLDREDSPWYPSVKLFRQNSIDDWDSVFLQIKVSLLNLKK